MKKLGAGDGQRETEKAKTVVGSKTEREGFQKGRGRELYRERRRKGRERQAAGQRGKN